MTGINSDQVCLLALGGNLSSQAGSPAETIRAGLDRLADHDIAVRAVSRLFQTPAFPAGNGPDYINAAAIIGCRHSPDDLLAVLHQVEHAFGRARDARWGARTLDLDLLAIGGKVLPDLLTWRKWHDLPAPAQRESAPDRLILPHPRLHERAFVLVPLADIAADWVHPVLQRSVSDMLSALPQAEIDAIHPV